MVIQSILSSAMVTLEPLGTLSIADCTTSPLLVVDRTEGRIMPSLVVVSASSMRTMHRFFGGLPFIMGTKIRIIVGFCNSQGIKKGQPLSEMPSYIMQFTQMPYLSITSKKSFLNASTSSPAIINRTYLLR